MDKGFDDRKVHEHFREKRTYTIIPVRKRCKRGRSFLDCEKTSASSSRTHHGIESAKSAGIYCIAIASTMGGKKLQGADEIVDSFEHLENAAGIRLLIMPSKN